ncbi:MAG: hypothetical protein NTW87_35615 [Planctomycetota bacterium]|nr:hypothetical protein [Planctomycetota bacterium]
MRRYLVLCLFALAVAGCGGGGESETSTPSKDTKKAKESSSNNPMDQIQGNVDWSIETKKSLREEGRARANEADKIINERFKGGK